MKYITAILCRSESCDNYLYLMRSKEKPSMDEIEEFVLSKKEIDILWEEREDDECEKYREIYNDIGSLCDWVTEEL